jgi:hypothetical protein
MVLSPYTNGVSKKPFLFIPIALIIIVVAMGIYVSSSMGRGTSAVKFSIPSSAFFKQNNQVSTDSGRSYTFARLLGRFFDTNIFISSNGIFVGKISDETLLGCRYTEHWTLKMPQEELIPRNDEFTQEESLKRQLHTGQPLAISMNGKGNISRLMLFYCQ